MPARHLRRPRADSAPYPGFLPNPTPQIILTPHPRTLLTSGVCSGNQKKKKKTLPTISCCSLGSPRFARARSSQRTDRLVLRRFGATRRFVPCPVMRACGNEWLGSPPRFPGSEARMSPPLAPFPRFPGPTVFVTEGPRTLARGLGRLPERGVSLLQNGPALDLFR